MGWHCARFPLRTNKTRTPPHIARGGVLHVLVSAEQRHDLAPEPCEEALGLLRGLVGRVVGGGFYALGGDDELHRVGLAVALVEEGLGHILALVLAGAEQPVYLVWMACVSSSSVPTPPARLEAPLVRLLMPFWIPLQFAARVSTPPV